MTNQNTLVIFEPYDSLREALKLILADDYNLLFTDTLEEALNQIANQKTELFILDVIGNKETGLEMIRETKLRFPDLVILIMSVDFTWAFKESAIRIGKTGIKFFDKPFEPRELLNRIHLIINGDPDRHRFILRLPLA